MEKGRNNSCGICIEVVWARCEPFVVWGSFLNPGHLGWEVNELMDSFFFSWRDDIPEESLCLQGVGVQNSITFPLTVLRHVVSLFFFTTSR